MTSNVKRTTSGPSTTTTPAHTFSEETMTSLRELGSVIANIRKRLLSEGYIIQGITYVAPDHLKK